MLVIIKKKLAFICCFVPFITVCAIWIQHASKTSFYLYICVRILMYIFFIFLYVMLIFQHIFINTLNKDPYNSITYNYK